MNFVWSTIDCKLNTLGCTLVVNRVTNLCFHLHRLHVTYKLLTLLFSHAMDTSGQDPTLQGSSSSGSPSKPAVTLGDEPPSLRRHRVSAVHRFFRLSRERLPWVSRIWAYLRGPDPSTPFPAPTPLFGGHFRFKSLSFHLPLEQPWIKLTHPFTSLWIFMLVAASYIIGLSFFVRAQNYLTPADSFIGCTDTYWIPDQGCGLDGVNCEFVDNSTFDFRCPAQCSETILENPRAVGAAEPVFVPLIVGGGGSGVNGSSPIYRGDSFICAAAVHAGAISDVKGGCASLILLRNQSEFAGVTAHGLTSIAFPSIFPLSFAFLSSTPLTHCTDLRNAALAFNVISSCILFLILRPQPLILFWSLVCMGFWHVTFFSQPRTFPPPISDAFGTFLPALFVCYAFWCVSWRHALPSFSSIPLERAVWYLAPFWAGVEFNVITDKIPLDRLVASDIQSRPGAIVALIVIVVVIFILVLNQLRVLRKAGFLIPYAKYYAVVGLVILIGSQLPGLIFRLHHYFAAIMLMPLTAVPTRLSAVYQAFVLGIFLNGVAAFDFDAIFQTASELVRDGALGTDRPIFVSNASSWNTSIALPNQTISWQPIPDDGNKWDSFSLMVDDVERLLANATNFTLSGLQPGLPHFFRLAYSKSGESGDYTKAATLLANGTWIDSLPGPAS